MAFKWKFQLCYKDDFAIKTTSIDSPYGTLYNFTYQKSNACTINNGTHTE